MDSLELVDNADSGNNRFSLSTFIDFTNTENAELFFAVP
jgi:hypothetical protein